MSDLTEQFAIRFIKDGEYEVVERATGETVYQGMIEEVNAWLDMYVKGFVL